MTNNMRAERATTNRTTPADTKFRPRVLRLLPGVMLVCGGLMVLNGFGLVHRAYALDAAAPAVADAMTAPPASKDFSDGDTEIASAAEVDVLTSLSKRRRELDAREAEATTKANILAATEARVDAKIAQLKVLQTQITGLLAQRDQAQKDQIAALVKTYSGMKPAGAAAIFNTLQDDVLVPIAQAMKPDDLSQILPKMNPDAAQKLTVKLANKLALPVSTGPLGAAMAPPAAAPPGKSSALTPPVQTAAAATAPAEKPESPAPPPAAAAPAAPAAPAAKPKAGG